MALVSNVRIVSTPSRDDSHTTYYVGFTHNCRPARTFVVPTLAAAEADKRIIEQAGWALGRSYYVSASR